MGRINRLISAAILCPATSSAATRDELGAVEVSFSDPIADLSTDKTLHVLDLAMPACCGPLDPALPLAATILQFGLLWLTLVGVHKGIARRGAPLQVASDAAIDRIRSIIARKPLERCADRLSSNPRRPNSAGASTSSTSATVRSL